MQDFRVFQIIIIAAIVGFLIWQSRNLYLRKSFFKDIWPFIILAIIVGIVAINPDYFTSKIANLLDIKSNVNVIFGFVLSVLGLLTLKLFSLYRKQQKTITKLVIELSVLTGEKNNTI